MGTTTSQTAAVVVSSALTSALYVALLGWSTEKHLSSGAVECTGPHDAWQVIALAMGLLAVVVGAAWLRVGWAAAAACAVSVTVLFAVDATTVTDVCTDQDGLWAIGAAALLCGSAGGLGLAAWLTGLVRGQAGRQAGSAS